jgi:CheY-like chemotaxis protein
VDTRKKEFPAMLAHELRIPRIPISDAVYRARHPAEPGVLDQSPLITMSERHAGTMSGLVEDLMDFTRLNAGKIGLNLARNPIELHGGSLQSRSNGPAEESEFVVRLPGQAPATPPPAPATDRAIAPNPPSRRRILVVDDNEDAARSLAKVLTVLFGQHVRVAHDGPTALATADAFEPEIVFLDIGLPGMSGLEVGSILRDRPWSDRCRLVAVTGWGQDKDRERSRAAGFDFHLVKPVRPDDIQKILTGKIVSWRE